MGVGGGGGGLYVFLLLACLPAWLCVLQIFNVHCLHFYIHLDWFSV